jgi:hypothetical protein
VKLNKFLGKEELELLNEEEVSYEMRKIKVSDNQGLQMFSDFYNESGQLSWRLTPQRLKSKMGSKGQLWGLFIKGTDEMVGSIGLKHIKEDASVDLAEMGYLMLHPNHRSLPNLMTLAKKAIMKAKSFDAVYITTNVKNRTINKLMDRTPKADKILKIKSNYSNNLLWVYSINSTRSPLNEDMIKAHFKDVTLQEL